MATKGERTRSSLLAAAVRRFAADGRRAVALADVARDVGVSPAAVYSYFPGKEALFEAAVDSDAAGLVEVALDFVTAGHLSGDLAELLQVLLDALPEHPLASRVLAGLEPDSTGRLMEIPALSGLRQALTSLLAVEQARGAVRDDIDSAMVADGLQTVVLALLMGALQTPEMDHDHRAAGVMALLDAALHVPAALRAPAAQRSVRYSRP